MGKIIFWLVVIFVVLLVLRLINVAASRSRDGPAASKRNPREAAMIRCVDCGVYLESVCLQLVVTVNALLILRIQRRSG